VNKFKYFVCNEAYGEAAKWILLEDVLPIQVQRSRQVKKMFTGNLNTPILTYPPFPSSTLQYKKGEVDAQASYLDWQVNPGVEAHYLRAQIADISQACVVSPMGFYTFDEEDEEEEEFRTVFLKDPEFDNVERAKLEIDGEEATDGWVHHMQHILPQGTCKWQDPRHKKARNPDADEDEDEEDEEDEDDSAVRETGPSLLTPIMQDPPVDGNQAWTSHLTSQRNKRFAGVVISSNQWPGAHALAFDRGRKFQNVYYGWGHRYSSKPYNPPLPPPAEAEYVIDATVTEATDPTREEEEAFEALNAVKEDGDGDGDGDEDDEDDS